MNPPQSQFGAALTAMGVLTTAGALGGTAASLAARKLQGDAKLGISTMGAAGGVMLAGLGGVATAAWSPEWRKAGLWTAGLGLGLPVVALVAAEVLALRQNAAAPALPATASITLQPGAMAVKAAVGSKLTLVVPGTLTSVTAGSENVTVSGSSVTLSVPGPGVVTVKWSNAQGAQTTTLTVSN